MEKINLKLYIILYAEMNLKWLTDLSRNAKITILVEEHIGENLCDPGTDRVLRAQKNTNYERNYTDKMYCIKTKFLVY